VLHLDRPPVPDLLPVDDAVARERRHVERCLADCTAALERLQAPCAPIITAEPPASASHAVRHARRVRRHADRLHVAQAALHDELALLLRYREFFQVFESLVGHELTWPDGQAFYIVLRVGAEGSLVELKRSLDIAVNGEVEVLHRELSSGEWAVLVLASAASASKVAALLSASRVEELPAPAGLGTTNLLRALPAIKARLADIPRAVAAIESQRAALRREESGWLCGLRAFLHDRLLLLEARARVHAARHLFVLEGWLPAAAVSELDRRLHHALGPDVVVTAIGTEHWSAANVPVVLHNPAIFRPFEVLTRTLPLPRYGSIDPTPFVAVFFPAFFGLMLGDVGYGVMLAVAAGVVWRRSQPGTVTRAGALVAMACASSAIVFGLLFGELFGSLGHFVGLRPVFNREQAPMPFLGLAVAIGGVHILLGLVLASVSAWRHGGRREAFGRGVTAAMLVLTAMALLAALRVLPAELFTPLVVAVLVAFPVLVALEGVVAVIELLSTFGHVLSYARIMALGTASLMLAVVANQMVGAMGSVLVGVVFALLFHLVNFAIGLFSPTIHALRLHYVEFFGQFFSPGGTQYRPLGHWHPSS